MDTIRADYITGDGQRIVCAGPLHGWEWMVSANVPGSYWAKDGRPRVSHYSGDTGSRFYIVPDSPEFRSFALGTMPPYAFADWLEETVPDIDARALQLLRLPYQPLPVVTDGRNVTG